MTRLLSFVVTASTLAMVGVGALRSSADLVVRPADAQSVSGSCSLSQPAFCETFSAPAGTGNRSGQLNGTLWGTSRVITGGFNMGQQQYNAWLPTQMTECNGSTATVQPDNNDVIVCPGQFREAVNDGGTPGNSEGTITVMSMYPKQPFDFANRTGIITFDVSNDTQGSHTVWPELWVTDKPVPAPFVHFGPLQDPQNGFGLRFSGNSGGTNPSTGGVLGPNCPNDNQPRWTFDSMVAFRNYVMDDSQNGGSLKVTPDSCVLASSGPTGPLNHVEVHLSQNQVDVFATDPGGSTLHHLATVSNANLTLTRGLVWLEDVHYNADKFGCGCQSQHTFTWANVGFDGPVLARDLAFDANDALTPPPGYPNQLNLGLNSPSSAPAQVHIPNVSGMQNATGALLTFNFYYYTPPQTITYSINGHVHGMPMPFPDTVTNQIRTLAAPLPISDVVAGTNTVSISADQPIVFTNVDLILQGAGGVVQPNGTGTNPPTSTPVPANTATPIPTATAIATPTTVPSSPPPATTGACSTGTGPAPSGAFVGMTAAPVDCPAVGTAQAFKITASAGGMVSSLHLFLAQGSNTGQVMVGLYSSAGNSNPATLLTEGALPQPVAGAWNSVSVPSVQIQSGTVYWLAVLQPSGSSGRVAVQDSTARGSMVTSAQTTLTVLPNTWTSGTSATQPMTMEYAN